MIRRTLSALLAVATGAIVGSASIEAQELAVAIAGPISGPEAALGEQMKRGAEMAVADINAAGGILGRQLKLAVGDDRCEPKQALAVANSFAEKEVHFVAGHYCLRASIAASSVYAENNILQIIPSATPGPAEVKAKEWKTVFRLRGSDDMEGIATGKFLAGSYKDKRVAIVHDNTRYGQGIAGEIRKSMNAAGLKEVLYASFKTGDKDFTGIVSQLKQTSVEVVYAASYPPEVGLLVKQSRDQGFGGQFVSGSALLSDEFWKISGKAGEGLLMAFPPNPAANPAAKSLREKLGKQVVDIDSYVLYYTYAAFQMYADAVARAKSLDALKVAAQIHGHAIDTVIGKLKYDRTGEISNPKYALYQWHEGRAYQTGVFTDCEDGSC